MKSAMDRKDREYWVWVTHPDYYLEENGKPRALLEPGPKLEGWWTCHKNTRAGDLILLYRTAPRSDIAYLLRAEDNASSLAGDPNADEMGWKYGCMYRSLYRLDRTLTYTAMKADPYLDDWPALRGRFQRSAFAVPAPVFRHLSSVLGRMCPEYRKVLAKADTTPVHILTEQRIEERLARDLGLLKPFGYKLDLYESPDGRSGRQFTCPSVGGRIDLLCIDRTGGGYVVIELKAGRADDRVYSQVSSYMGWVTEHLPHGRKVAGLVISDGEDGRFSGSALISHKTSHPVWRIDLKDLGLHGQAKRGSRAS